MQHEPPDQYSGSAPDQKDPNWIAPSSSKPFRILKVASMVYKPDEGSIQVQDWINGARQFYSSPLTPGASSIPKPRSFYNKMKHQASR